MINDTPELAGKPFLTIRETAIVLGVDAKLVRRLIQTGQLPALKLGTRTYRVPSSAVFKVGEL